ncbi:hypothetical protein ACLOJK_027111, partial [Asimina triloba]
APDFSAPPEHQDMVLHHHQGQPGMAAVRRLPSEPPIGRLVLSKTMAVKNGAEFPHQQASPTTSSLSKQWDIVFDMAATKPITGDVSND